jgi:glycosyltransferase involved in cell wall biosynthesis
MHKPDAGTDPIKRLLSAAGLAVQNRAEASPPAAAAPANAPSLRILLLLRAVGFGGAERQVIQLAQGLARRGHQVRVTAFYPGEFDREIGGFNPELVVVGKRGRGDVARFCARITRSIARWRPDIVYSFLPVPNLLAGFVRALFYRRAALVWGVRGTPLDLARYDRLERASIRLERLASRLPDLVIANSRAGAAWAAGAGFAARRVAMIANGIDTDRFCPPTPSQRTAARSALGCPAAAPVVVVVARIDPMKDHPTFLEGFAIATKAVPDLIAVIAGDGPRPALDQLHAQAAALGVAGQIIWSGARREVREIYAAADLLCLPSRFGEGFPNVVGEAMACGLPCVVTAVGDSAAVVGSTGRVVMPGRADELAAAILDCIGPIRESRRPNLAARNRIVVNFGIEAMISATERALAQTAVLHQRRNLASC